MPSSIVLHRPPILVLSTTHPTTSPHSPLFPFSIPSTYPSRLAKSTASLEISFGCIHAGDSIPASFGLEPSLYTTLPSWGCSTSSPVVAAAPARMM